MSKRWDLRRSLGKGREGGVKTECRREKRGGERYSLHGIFILRISANLTSRRKNRAGTGAGDRMKQHKECRAPGTIHRQGDEPHLHSTHTLHSCQPKTYEHYYNMKYENGFSRGAAVCVTLCLCVSREGGGVVH